MTITGWQLICEATEHRAIVRTGLLDYVAACDSCTTTIQRFTGITFDQPNGSWRIASRHCDPCAARLIAYLIGHGQEIVHDSTPAF